MKTVAVIGASKDRSRFGNKAVRAFQQQGYAVYPVHPSETQIEGLPAFKSIRDLPTRPDIVTVYVGPVILTRLLPEIAARGCGELWLNPGTVSLEVIEQAKLLGLEFVEHCSLLAIGVSPASL